MGIEGGGRDRGGERAGKVPDEPDEAFCSSVLLRLQLIEDEILEGFGLEGRSELSVSDFLPIVNTSPYPFFQSKPTLTLPSMSFFTGVNATEPKTSASLQLAAIQNVEHREGKLVPKSVVNDSAASRNSVVAMALSFSLLTGTSVKDTLRVSRKVPPSGYDCAIVCCGFGWDFGQVVN